MKTFSTVLHRTLLSVMLFLTLAVSASAFDTAADSGLLMLVSKTHSISADYVPKLVSLDNIDDISSKMQVRSEAAQALTQMYADMTESGVTTCHVISGYRSYEYQKYLVDSKVAKRIAKGEKRDSAYYQVTLSTAPAGCSEHQLGLALDLSTGTVTSQSFANSDAGQWMEAHAWEYGFIRRYQSDKAKLTGIVNEAWHYRYVGVPHAQIMVENNWCLEEYLAYLHKNGSYTLAIDDKTTYTVYWTQNQSAEYDDIIDISRDNDGGWVITTCVVKDYLKLVHGHWSEAAFLALEERGVTYTFDIDPSAAITAGEFSALCGLPIPQDGNHTISREEAAVALAATLPDKTLTYLLYTDLDKISGGHFQSIQIAVTNKIFSHGDTLAFRPDDVLTWGEAAAAALRYREKMDSKYK